MRVLRSTSRNGKFTATILENGKVSTKTINFDTRGIERLTFDSGQIAFGQGRPISACPFVKDSGNTLVVACRMARGGESRWLQTAEGTVSYCYDVMSRKWAELREQLPAEVRDGETAFRFEVLISEMHEANHRLKDAINHDDRVTRAARNLDNVGREK